MRKITKVKQFQKLQDGEAVDHVVIAYTEGNKVVTMHETEKAAPEFYKLFSELSTHACRIGEFADHEADRTRVTGVSVSHDCTEGGDEVMGVVFTAKRRLVASPQDLTFNTPRKTTEHNDPNQKLSDDCRVTVDALLVEADEYIDGKREQVEMKLETPIGQAIEPEQEAEEPTLDQLQAEAQ